ncbi:MAG: putative damage-inducible protein DinB [Sphingobacteriales bacterium]|jgi:uncharacterized damage-inducible protein DinB
MKCKTIPILSTLLTLLILSFTSCDIGSEKANQKDSSKQFSEIYLAIWATAAKTTLEVAESMPGNLYSYKPTGVSKTFGQQLVHIAYTCSFFQQGMIEGNKVEYSEPNADNMTKEEIVEFMQNTFSIISDKIAEAESSQLEELITHSSGKVMTKEHVYYFMHDHLTNHRAKANLYIRMNGIEPPAYSY